MELRAKLQGARIVGRGHLSEVPVPGVLIDALELRVVEDVEELEPQFQARPFGSLNGMVLNRDQLKLKSPGPTTASFPALPKPWFGPPFQGATGLAKELVLNHASRFFG
jgi:hypothetical protein